MEKNKTLSRYCCCCCCYVGDIGVGEWVVLVVKKAKEKGDVKGKWGWREKARQYNALGSCMKWRLTTPRGG